MPLIEIQRQLGENGLNLNLKYIAFLRDKILRERTVRIDQKTLSSALSAFEDVLTEVAKNAWSIALSNLSTRKEKIAALREVRESHGDMIDKLFDAGVFNRKIGVIEHRPKVALTIEQKAQLLETMIRWGIIKSVQEHEQPNQQLTDADKGSG